MMNMIKASGLKLIFICLILLACVEAVEAEPVVDYLRITADVNNGYAVTTVEEKLSNPLGTATEGEFKFLIPVEAFISSYSLIIDGVEYSADVLPKEEAKEKFEEAATKGEPAGLLETKKENVFSYSLSFAPYQSIIVRLTYEQPVKKVLGEYEYVLPLRKTHPVQDLSVNISIASVNEITSIETPGFTEARKKYISATEGRITYSARTLPNKDLTVVFTTRNPPVNGDMLFYNTGVQGYLMHIFSPTEEDLGTTALSKDIIFVIDKSGSMSGDKIAQVKRVFTRIIDDLPPDDYFNIIFFDGAVRAYQSTLMEASTEKKAEAATFINSLDAEGSTDINQALLDALSMFEPGSEHVPIVVFLTDGEPTTGIISPYVIRKNAREANRAEVSIFTIAFGITDESYYDFLKALSMENYGKAERFYPEENAEAEISGFYDTISTPLITDLRFTYTDSVSDVVNTGMNNLFAGSDAIVVAKYPASTTSITSKIEATTRTGSRKFEQTFSVVSKPENEFIPRLWAYSKIRKLLDRIDVEGETDALVSDITELSLEFEFVTPYTSLFVEVPVTENETEVTTTVADTLAMEEYATKDDGVVPVPPPAVAPTPIPAATPAPGGGEGEIDRGGEKELPRERPFDRGGEAPVPQPSGFEVVFAVAGLLAALYLVLRMRE
jgi:uncharacterized protein YegL